MTQIIFGIFNAWYPVTMKRLWVIAAWGVLSFSGFAWGAGSAVQLSRADKDLWIRCIKKVRMRPPCCGACALFNEKDSKKVWEYLTSDDPSKRSGEYLEAWEVHKAKLLAEFKEASPARYVDLYGPEDLKEKTAAKGEPGK
jgi:hypothetical protein